MSRVTPPVKKGVQTFLRSISSTAKVDRPSSILLSSQSHQLRTLADLKQACSLRGLAVSGSKAELLERLNTSELKTNPPSRNHSTLSPHRPLMARPSKRPLMQTFRTSAAPPAAHDTSTIDYMIFPSPSEASESALYKLRVPLLPDNYTPNRAKGTGHEVETPDGPILNQEILVVAAHPEQVLPSAMTEVVGNEGMDDVKLDMAYDKESDSGEQGMIRQIWSGLVDDFLGPKKGAIKPALS